MEQVSQEVNGHADQAVGVNHGNVAQDNRIKLQINLEGAAVEQLVSIGELHIHLKLGGMAP